MGTTEVAKESLQKFFQLGLDWLTASSFGTVIYFAIMFDLPKFLISLAVTFGLCVLVLLQRFAIRDKANAPPVAYDGRRSSRLGFFAANALTFVRPGIGIAAGMAIANRNITLGFVLFLFGLTSDILDGLIARMFQAQSAHGREWDAVADAIHNFAFGLGVAWFAIGPPIDVPRVITLSVMVIVFLASRFLVSVHSITDKCLSGLWRILLFALTITLLPHDWRLAGFFGGAVLAILGGTYELGVIRNEIIAGTRKWI